MSPFVAEENRARTGAYRKDEVLEDAVLAVNRALEPHEPPVPADLPQMPCIFVFGLPRSGTTLTHQVLAWGLDVGYVSNVMARFWLAPYAGAMVSQAVLDGERDGSFQSDYAKTPTPAGGHEFAYFWHRWLGIGEVSDLLDFSGDSLRADWHGAAAAVRRMQLAFDRPLVFKTNFAAQFLPAFARRFPMPLFVNAWREPWSVARSILEARRRYYGDPSVWWSTHPPDYEDLCGLPAVEQVARQVASLRRAYARQIERVPAELVIDSPYDALCARPGSLIDAVRDRCRAVYGFELEPLHPLPERFTARSAGRASPTAEEQALAAALERALAEQAE